MRNLLLFILLTACSRCFGVSTVGDLISSTVGTNVNIAATDSTGRFISTNIIHGSVNTGAVSGNPVTFYLDNVTGNDTNNGLFPTTAWQTIQQAESAATNGNSIALNSREVWPIPSAISLTNPGLAWTWWSPPGYPASPAVISNSNPLSNMFNVLTSSNTFSGLVFVGNTNNLTNINNPYTAAGCFFCGLGVGTNCHFNSFVGCTWSNLAFAVFASGSSYLDMTNWFFSDCSIGNCAYGIYQIQSPTSLLYPCAAGWDWVRCVETNLFGYSNLAFAGIISVGSSNMLVISNLCHDAGQALATNILGGYGGVEYASNENSTIAFSESYHIHNQNGGDGSGFQSDNQVSGLTMHDNYSHDNDGPGFEIYNSINGLTFYGNRAVHNCLHSYTNPPWAGEFSAISQYLTNLNVYSNQFEAGMPGASAIQSYYAIPVGGSISNNLLGNVSGSIVSWVTGGVFSTNYYWGGANNGPTWVWNGITYPSIAQWVLESGEVGASYVNPQSLPVVLRPAFHRTDADMLALTNSVPLLNANITIISTNGYAVYLLFGHWLVFF